MSAFSIRRPKLVRIAALTAAGLAAATILILVILAAFPWGMFKDRVARQISEEIGSPVTIEAMSRLDHFSLHPVVALRAVHIPQPEWAKGDLATIGTMHIGFSALALLRGKFSLETLDIMDARIALARRKDGVENWSGKRSGGQGQAGSGRPALRLLTVRNTVVSYSDAKQNRAFSARLSVDRNEGLVLSGTGHIHGAPVVLHARGATIDGKTSGGGWPFEARITGKAVGMHAVGTMDSPLDTGHLTARISAHGDDLALVDAIIEAGLPGTQPVAVKAEIRHDSPDWTIRALTGTIGRSDISGHATIKKRDGRTRIDGALAADRFDFEDLSSDEGKRIAAAKRARFGERVVPDTAIDLATVDKTDGKLDISVKTLLWPGPSPFQNLRGTLVLDKSRMTIAPLSLGLKSGRMDGKAVVDQRDGGPVLTLALALHDARMLDFFPDAAIDGALRGRIDLTGTGKTVRSAIGRSNGVVALFAQDGTIPARTASLLGQDIGRGVTADKSELASMRCVAARMEVKAGKAHASPVIIDTSRALTQAAGTIDLASEQMNLAIDGAPKKDSLLRLEGTITVAGTIKSPDIRLPKRARSIGGILGMVGRAIAGKQDATAEDADCTALERKTLS